MSDYSEFFLNSKASIVQLELIQIKHPNFSKDYNIVRNASNGVTVLLETEELLNFEYYPARISNNGNREDLDFGLKIELGDLGEIIPDELDNVSNANSFGITAQALANAAIRIT